MRTLISATLFFGFAPLWSLASQAADSEADDPAPEPIAAAESPTGEDPPAIEEPVPTESESEVIAAAPAEEPAEDPEAPETKAAEVASDSQSTQSEAENIAPEPGASELRAAAPSEARPESTPAPTAATAGPAGPTQMPVPQIVVQAPSEELTARLAVMEQYLVTQHEREIALYRDTIQLVVIFGVVFAVIACLGLLAACFLNYRAIVAVQTVVAPRQPELEEAPVNGLLPQSSSNVPGIERVQASGTRFQSRMSQLEDRLNELEHMAGRPDDDATAILDEFRAGREVTSAADLQIENHPPRRVVPRAAIMVHKAQTLSHLGKLQDALSTLDDAAQLEQLNADVHLARGQVLERLGRIGDAIEAYDRAFESDDSNTNALLMKAGALNKQEKFSEALACYERALEVHRTTN